MTQVECLLKQSLRYEPETGDLYWLERPADHFASEGYCKAWNTRFRGKKAFTAINGAGYRHGAFGGSHYLAHRVAWLLQHGEWPEAQIDHANRDRADNRLSNLRAATQSQNLVNRAKSAGKKSRFVGVSRAANGKWFAYVGRRNEYEYLGIYACETAAAIARAVRATEIYGEFS